MAPHTNALLAHLSLVFPPIPNSYVSNVSQDPTAVEALKESDFYMIGGRRQVIFTPGSVKIDPENQRINFELQIPNGPSSIGFLKIPNIPALDQLEEKNNISLSVVNNQLSMFKLETNNKKSLVFTYHPDVILWLRGRHTPYIGGLENHLELMLYDLLYVGIANKTDSYSRLIQKGHLARQQILSEEPQRYPGARVSDEIFLFLFKIDPLLIKSWGPSDAIETHDLNMVTNNASIVADAEKAFISLLKPKYNKQLYPNYPKGKDGIYDVGYTGYSYSIAEGIAFRTPYGEMKGARQPDILLSNHADYIFIQGNFVQLNIAGIDYDIDALDW